ncbi:hypothetical protein [Streptomyces cucumeris]
MAAIAVGYSLDHPLHSEPGHPTLPLSFMRDHIWPDKTSARDIRTLRHP